MTVTPGHTRGTAWGSSATCKHTHHWCQLRNRSLEQAGGSLGSFTSSCPLADTNRPCPPPPASPTGEWWVRIQAGISAGRQVWGHVALPAHYLGFTGRHMGVPGSFGQPSPSSLWAHAGRRRCTSKAGFGQGLGSAIHWWV